MTIFTALKMDHARIASLLERMVITSVRGTKRRRQLFAQLKWELTMHTQAEGMVLYSVLDSHPQARDIVARAREEHILIDDLLDELEATSAADQTWCPKLKTLKWNVKLHIAEEERQLFRAAHEILSRGQAEMLGEQMQLEKLGFPRPPARII